MRKHGKPIQAFNVRAYSTPGRRFQGLAAIVVLASLVATKGARADEPALTRQRVAELVKTAPMARVARAEAAVSDAAVTAAGGLSLENPVLSGMGGVRFSADGSRPFNGVATVSWPIDLGGKRGARIDAAEAERRSAVAAARSQGRQFLLEALLRHAQVLRDDRAVGIAVARHALSERVYAAAQRRYTAGSVPELDVALAGMQEKRDASAEATAVGARDADRLVLVSLLGLSGEPAVEGSLVPEGNVPTLTGLVNHVDERPDVRAASAALDAARAKAERERAFRAPTVSLLAQYERDDRDNIGLLGLAVPIPILNANRSEVAISGAEVDAAGARAVHTRWLAAGQLRELDARYRAAKAATDSLAPTAALAARAVNLATRGYELGENDLASVLLVRREAIDAEAMWLETQHALAAAKIELLVVGGRIPR